MSDRRQVIVGAAATAMIAAMPATVAAVEVADPMIERMKVLLHQLFGLLRSEGYAVARLNDGGKILVWLNDRSDITSMIMMSMDDDVTPDVVDVLERAATIEPTMVRF